MGRDIWYQSRTGGLLGTFEGQTGQRRNVGDDDRHSTSVALVGWIVIQVFVVCTVHDLRTTPSYIYKKYIYFSSSSL